jgi:non-ribosomal peptide synthase protein (TIGR01720 family)
VRGADYARLAADEVFLQFAPLAFDASTLEIWGPLANGGRLAVMPAGELPSLAELGRVVREQGVTTLWLTAGLFHQMVETQLDDLRGVRQLMSGGDVLSVPHVQRVRREVPDCRLINAYGPTENTTFTTCHTVGAADEIGASVPIGRPISNTRVYVLDGRMRPVPVGVPGELYAAGDGLARGYLDRPGLTAERFVPDPFAAEPGGRLYRTGDLARWRPDGTIEFLGRLDGQVKLRGFRIELGEIEAALGRHPAVREVVVVARLDAPGQKRLAAYVVASAEPGPTAEELRSFLRERLPEYMVPSSFVSLAELPLTPNGKVDRRALPAPDRASRAGDEAGVPPRTPLEAELVAIWAPVLGLEPERIGVHDNFFDLGGDSILSIQLVARANEAGIRLTPGQLFQHQTIAELAAVAGTAPELDAEPDRPTGAVPLTPIQRWLFEQQHPDPHHWNSAYVLEATEPLRASQLEGAVRCLADHHDALRLRFRRTADGWQQSYADDGAPSFRSVDLSSLAAAEQDRAMRAVAADLETSLDLEAGPLVRLVHFLRGPDQSERVLIVMHHLLVDAVSWRILLEDLQSAYQQLGQGLEPRLSSRTTTYGRWAERLASHADSAALRPELDYWASQRWSTARPLPVDFPRGVNTEGSARTLSVALDVEETRALLFDLPAARQTRINDVLLTALTRTFAAWTGSSSVLVGLKGHGREPLFEDVDLSRTVGWFTTIYPALLSLEGGRAAEPDRGLASIKSQLRAIPVNGIGYGLLRYMATDPAVAGPMAAVPVPEVSFNYLSRDTPPPSGQALFELCAEESGALSGPLRGPMCAPRARRAHLIDVVGAVTADRLEFQWLYSRRVHRRETIEAVALRFVAELRSLIAEGRADDQAVLAAD